MNNHIQEFGAEPMAKVLSIVPSTYRRHVAMARDPDLRSPKAKQDEADLAEIRRSQR